MLGVSGYVVLSRGKRHAWEERCFCNTEEESDDDQVSVSTGTSSSGRHNGPQSSPGWDVHRRAGSSKEHVANIRWPLSFELEGVDLPGELHKHVSDIQDGHCNIELIAFETKVLFEGAETRLTKDGNQRTAKFDEC